MQFVIHAKGGFQCYRKMSLTLIRHYGNVKTRFVEANVTDKNDALQGVFKNTYQLVMHPLVTVYSTVILTCNGVTNSPRAKITVFPQVLHIIVLIKR